MDRSIYLDQIVSKAYLMTEKECLIIERLWMSSQPPLQQPARTDDSFRHLTFRENVSIWNKIMVLSPQPYSFRSRILYFHFFSMKEFDICYMGLMTLAYECNKDCTNSRTAQNRKELRTEIVRIDLSLLQCNTSQICVSILFANLFHGLGL